MYWSEKEEEARKIASSKKHFITYSQHSTRKFGKSVVVCFFCARRCTCGAGQTDSRNSWKRALCRVGISRLGRRRRRRKEHLTDDPKGERERQEFRIPHYSPPFPLSFLLSPELCSGNPVLSLPEQPPPPPNYCLVGTWHLTPLWESEMSQVLSPLSLFFIFWLSGAHLKNKEKNFVKKGLGHSMSATYS